MRSKRPRGSQRTQYASSLRKLEIRSTRNPHLRGESDWRYKLYQFGYAPVGKQAYSLWEHVKMFFRYLLRIDTP